MSSWHTTDAEMFCSCFVLWGLRLAEKIEEDEGKWNLWQFKLLTQLLTDCDQMLAFAVIKFCLFFHSLYMVLKDKCNEMYWGKSVKKKSKKNVWLTSRVCKHLSTRKNKSTIILYENRRELTGYTAHALQQLFRILHLGFRFCSVQTSSGSYLHVLFTSSVLFDNLPCCRYAAWTKKSFAEFPGPYADVV